MPVNYLEDYDIQILERYWFKRNELEGEAKQVENGEAYVNERLKLVNAMKAIYETESEDYRTFIDMYFVEKAYPEDIADELGKKRNQILRMKKNLLERFAEKIGWVY